LDFSVQVPGSVVFTGNAIYTMLTTIIRHCF